MHRALNVNVLNIQFFIKTEKNLPQFAGLWTRLNALNARDKLKAFCRKHFKKSRSKKKKNKMPEHTNNTPMHMYVYERDLQNKKHNKL